MQGNLNIGTYLGIPVKIHWSFGLLILFVSYVGLTNGLNGKEIIAFALYIGVLFFCVVLHEYGHALMARRYGVKTRDIILSPIGGVARLESIPEEPYKEFFIALAGPLVNVIIAVFLSIVTLVFYSGSIFPSSENIELLKFPSEFIRFVIVMNIALFVFNLVPAFPMDGGRVLRSLLAIKIGRVKATRIASIIGRGIAIGFIILGLMNSYLLLSIIGVFIYITAGSENKSIEVSEMLKDTKAGHLARDKFTVIKMHDPLSIPIDIYQRGGEKNFLVVNEENKAIGSLPELFIIDAIKDQLHFTPVAQMMSNKITIVSPEAPLTQVYNLMQKEGMAVIGVGDGISPLKIIDREAMSRFLTLQDKIKK